MDNKKQKRREAKARWAREWRKNHPEEAKAKDRHYRRKYNERRKLYSRAYHEAHKDDEGYKKKRNNRSIQYYYNNKDKARARALVGKAVLRGELVVPEHCKECGMTNGDNRLEGHHHDYAKPLDVVWLCKQCHENLHHQAIDQYKSNLMEKLR